MSVPSTKLHGVTSQNTGIIYQTTLLYTKINVPSTKLQSIPKYMYHLPNYSIISQGSDTIYQTGVITKIWGYHLPNYSVISHNIGTITKQQCYIPKYRYHNQTTVLYPQALVPNTKLNRARPHMLELIYQTAQGHIPKHHSFMMHGAVWLYC